MAPTAPIPWHLITQRSWQPTLSMLLTFTGAPRIEADRISRIFDVDPEFLFSTFSQARNLVNLAGHGAISIVRRYCNSEHATHVVGFFGCEIEKKKSYRQRLIVTSSHQLRLEPGVILLRTQLWRQTEIHGIRAQTSWVGHLKLPRGNGSEA